MIPRRAVVELELISRIDQDGDCTETRTFARGELTRLRDSVTLAYREPDGDSRTQIRLSENGQALIHRTGEFSGRIPVCPGEWAEFLYHTPYGDLELACEGLELLLREENTAGQLVLRYRIGTPDGDIISENHITIIYKESAN